MRGKIAITELSFEYPDGTKAIDELSLKISAGESIAILGPNGAGKTTLVMHLNGINTIQAGKIIIGDKEVNDNNLKNIRREVGIVFQDPEQQLFMPLSLIHI